MKYATPPEALARIMARSIVDADSGCRIWQGPVLDNGYPSMGSLGQQYAHRVAYIAANGAIAPGLHVDHVCHNRDLTCSGGASCIHRRCVNPDHLEAVPSRTNTLRSSNSIAGINSRRTECKWGHAFDDENTLIKVSPKGHIWRRCRQCSTRRRRASTARAAAAKAASTREPIDRAA